MNIKTIVCIIAVASIYISPLSAISSQEPTLYRLSIKHLCKLAQSHPKRLLDVVQSFKLTDKAKKTLRAMITQLKDQLYNSRQSFIENNIFIDDKHLLQGTICAAVAAVIASTGYAAHRSAAVPAEDRIILGILHGSLSLIFAGIAYRKFAEGYYYPEYINAKIELLNTIQAALQEN